MGRAAGHAYTAFIERNEIAAQCASRSGEAVLGGRCIVAIDSTFGISSVTLAFAVLGAIVIGALLAAMHVKRRYDPNLIGALIGALLCFLLLEALPSLI